jgi:DNA-binding transcriptional LysR family regulator
MSDYDQLEFRHLKFIQAVGQERSFTAAAERVHTTQSNISTQISQLEELFDVQLFNRERDGATPTPYGEVLISCARDLLQVREDAIEMLKALRTGEITPLRLGYSSLVEKQTLGSLIETTRVLFPHCEIVSEGDEIQDLETRVGNGDLDGALVTLPIEHNSDLTTCIVERQMLHVCMRSDDSLADHEAIPTHLLNGRLSIFQYPKVHKAAYARLLELLSSVGIVPKPSNPTTNREHIQWMVHEGQCLAFVRCGARLLPGLTSRPIHGVDWTIDTALVLKPVSQHPALALLLRELRKRSGEMVPMSAPKKPTDKAAMAAHRKPHGARAKAAQSLSLFEAS